MKFCPRCQSRMTKNISGFTCLKCHYAEGATARYEASSTESEDPLFNVLDDPEGDAALPAVKIDCEKCGYGEAVWWMMQTRSADEPTTQFYRCIKCKHTWRDYS